MLYRRILDESYDFRGQTVYIHEVQYFAKWVHSGFHFSVFTTHRNAYTIHTFSFIYAFFRNVSAVGFSLVYTRTLPLNRKIYSPPVWSDWVHWVRNHGQEMARLPRNAFVLRKWRLIITTLMIAGIHVSGPLYKVSSPLHPHFILLYKHVALLRPWLISYKERGSRKPRLLNRLCPTTRVSLAVHSRRGIFPGIYDRSRSGQRGQGAEGRGLMINGPWFNARANISR